MKDNKREYFKEIFIKYITSQTKENLIKLIKLNVDKMSTDDLIELIDETQIPYIPFFVKNRNEIIDVFLDLDTIFIKGYCKEDDWYDFQYSYSLDTKTRDLLDNIIKLIVYLYEHSEEENAFELVNKLYELTFECTYATDYNDDYETESYSIDHIFDKLKTCNSEEQIKSIYVHSLVKTKNIPMLHSFLKHNYSVKDKIDEIYFIDKTVLFDLAMYSIENANLIDNYTGDSCYIFDLINDFDLYQKAVIFQFIKFPKIITEFLNKYLHNDLYKQRTIDTVTEVFLSLSTLDANYFHYDHLLEILEKIGNSELIIKFYELYKGQIPFIILNNLPDDLFFKYLREEDKNKYLDSELNNFMNYNDFNCIIRGLFFNTSNKYQIIETGIKKCLKRTSYNKRLILNRVIEYAVKIGENYTSKSYYSYFDVISIINEDIRGAVNLFKIVKDNYPNRPKLQKIFSQK